MFIMKTVKKRSLSFVLLFASTIVFAGAPQWWVERGLVPSVEGEVASIVIGENYSVANQGQLMHIAKMAATELDYKVSGDGAGSLITSMVSAFPIYNPANPDANYAVVNIGQVKHVVKIFYDRLWEIEISSPGAVVWPTDMLFLGGGTNSANHKYPWTDLPASTASNYNAEMDKNYLAANVGQIKYLFSWSVNVPEIPIVVVDTNENGIDDAWEILHFGGLISNSTENLSGDGISIFDAYHLGLDPNVNNMDPTATGSIASAIIYDDNSMLIEIGEKSLTRDEEGNVTNMTSNE